MAILPGGRYESVRAAEGAIRRERGKYTYSPCEGTGGIIPHAYNISPATIYLSLFRYIYTIVWQEPLTAREIPFISHVQVTELRTW